MDFNIQKSIPPTLEEIRARVRDGIFLGGNFDHAYEEYLIAHRDRCVLLDHYDWLMRKVDELDAACKRAIVAATNHARIAEKYTIVEDEFIDIDGRVVRRLP